MKITKTIIHIWLALTSAVLFAASWITLAHSPKPSQLKVSEIPAMPALAPVPSIEQLTLQRQFQGPVASQRPITRLRTGGS